ncbi:MAG: type III polyketide synthase [Bacteroidetes bacterium]|nr:type III polyketide synthase [Bacteroidota bacterium]MBP6315336.1 type III polyketide synthase [Chitinophagaceae bacterium]
MAYIQSIGTADAPFSHSQSEIFNFMLEMYHVPSDDVDKVKRLYDRSEIETRYSAIQDFALPKNQWTFIDTEQTVSVEKRMEKFFEIAPALCEKAIRQCIPDASEWNEITHLITVSCTGLSAPGLDIQLMQRLKLKPNIQRFSINFMGCYAAIHALKQAKDICTAHSNAKVLIVDIELCTLHFQNTYSMENVAASLLFADGAAAVLISNEPGIYSIENFYSEVAIAGYNDMAWNISSEGFLMTLSAYVPSIIAENIGPMLMNSLAHMNLSKTDIQHWAIHPGGKKIISEVQKALLLTDNDLAMSRSILKNYGNMSSVTILYLLKQMQQGITATDENVYAVAFGPGLTIESLFLKSC